jgi:hypothetical protein
MEFAGIISRKGSDDSYTDDPRTRIKRVGVLQF